MSARVVITGLGPVTSAGIGTEDFFKGIWAQRCVRKPVPPEFTRHFALHSHWYVPLPEFSLAEHGLKTAHENIMQSADRMAVLGTQLALEDAGFERSTGEAFPRFSGVQEADVLLGAGLGSMQTALESYLAHCLPQPALQTHLPERRLTFSRMVVPRTMPNSPAAWASICFGLGGACQTVNASCASGTYAIGEAFRRIQGGHAKLAITGGVEALVDPAGFMMRGFDVLGALTQAEDGVPNCFGKSHSGFLFAEGGACVLVLEELGHAKDRGARIYAELADFQANSDAANIVQLDPIGNQIRRLLTSLSRGRQIDYLNTHGTGTPANDQVEADAIRAVFGGPERQPWLNSTKGIIGHTIGASGAIEAAVTALSIANGAVHGNLVIDPLEGLNLPQKNCTGPLGAALSMSYGFGGHNGGLLLTRYDPETDGTGSQSGRGE